MPSFDRCNEVLDWLASVSFRFRPKSSEPLGRGLLLAKSFDALSEQDRLHVQGAFQWSVGPKLLTLSGFMAEAAINTRDPSWIRAAVILHIIEDFKKDYRDNIRHLVLVAYAANRIGVDLRDVANSVMQLASPHARSYLIDFLSRDDGLSDLASFGIKETIVDLYWSGPDRTDSRTYKELIRGSVRDELLPGEVE
jgi:hypothetical protein